MTGGEDQAPETRPMPLYRCHKKVRAAKIISMPPKPDHDTPTAMTLGLLFPDGAEGTVTVDSAWLTRNPALSVGGYFIHYCENSDNYTSYSPAAPFESGYTLLTGEYFDFGIAIQIMREGGAVRRAFWPEGVFISLSPGAENMPAASFWNPHNAEHARANGGAATVHPCITMVEADGTITQGWTPNCYDVFGDDYHIVE